MKISRLAFKNNRKYIFFVAAFIVVSLISYGGYHYYSLAQDFKFAKEEFSSDRASFQNIIRRLEAKLASSTEENIKLTEAFTSEKGKNDFFEFQIKNITNTVGTLEKLSKTDPELLKKYSKVYFLNENYIPATLTDITSSEYVYTKDKILQVHSSIWPYLQKLLESAKQDSINLQIISAYRSFAMQASLKSSYKVIYGAGTANQFSAEQGYSEHQLGTTVDFTVPSIGASFEKFKATPAYSWLNQNAYKYGFILSYPENNSYYQFEPWHWRFVGVGLATKLYNDHKNFYDLDQREIDIHLINLFD